MNSEKALTIKRIVIFTVLAFLPLMISTPILEHILGGKLYVGENAAHPIVMLVGIFGMLSPTVANILTRLITKEGLKDHYLNLEMKGKAKYYLMAILIPAAYGFIEALIIAAKYGGGAPLFRDDILMGISLLLSQVAGVIYMLLPYFGEEFGWRAYLTPKMTKLMPEPLAVFISGIIWGLWHAPLTISGHNFGVDYPLYPIGGILFMCLDCALLGAFLTVLTKRTNSVFPAALAHGANNSLIAGIMAMALFSEETMSNIENASAGLMENIEMLIPLIILGVGSYVILIIDYIKEKKTATQQ